MRRGAGSAFFGDFLAQAPALEPVPAPLDDAPVVNTLVLPSLVCHRCNIAFDAAADVRAHFRAEHMPRAAARDGVAVDSAAESSDDIIDVDEDAVDAPSAESEGERVPAAAGLPASSEGRALVRIAESDTLAYVYKCVLLTCGREAVREAAADRTRSAPVDVVRDDLLRPGETWAVLMFQSGFFAAAVFQMSPEEGAATASGAPVARHAVTYPLMQLHKRFHRYTTRRKQGGSQSAHDSAKGSTAKSAGAQLRRAGEAHLLEDMHGMFTDPTWAVALRNCRRIFTAVPVAMRKWMYDAAAPTLTRGDARIANVPCTVERPSVAETARVCDMIASIIVPTVAVPVAIEEAAVAPVPVAAVRESDGATAAAASGAAAVLAPGAAAVPLSEPADDADDDTAAPVTTSTRPHPRRRNKPVRRKPAATSAAAPAPAAPAVDDDALLEDALARAHADAVAVEAAGQLEGMLAAAARTLRVPEDVLTRAVLLSIRVKVPSRARAAAALRSVGPEQLFAASEQVHMLTQRVREGATPPQTWAECGWDTLAAACAAVCAGEKVDWDRVALERVTPRAAAPAPAPAPRSIPAPAPAPAAPALSMRERVLAATLARLSVST